ncbi:MAG UNVERIFIED_CONTAM: MFS transporter, partial [Thermobifida fusca]
RSVRRRVLLACQFAGAVIALILAVDIFAATVQPWHLLVTAFLNGSVLSLMMPTQQSLVPALVERSDLTNAIALMSAAVASALVILVLGLGLQSQVPDASAETIVAGVYRPFAGQFLIQSAFVFLVGAAAWIVGWWKRPLAVGAHS